MVNKKAIKKEKKAPVTSPIAFPALLWKTIRNPERISDHTPTALKKKIAGSKRNNGGLAKVW